MSIRQFELFHGAVLAKLVRSDHPVTLRLIETKEESWSVYTINNEVELFIKICTTPRKLSREKDAISWPFIFSVDQVETISNLKLSKEVYVALVCGCKDLSDPMQIAFFTPAEINQIIDFNATDSQSFTVKYLPRKKLRLIIDYKEVLLINQKALESWKVPGN